MQIGLEHRKNWRESTYISCLFMNILAGGVEELDKDGHNYRQ